MIALSTVELPDPPAASSFGEIRALREPARLAWRSRRLVAAPRGDGRVVIVVPGFRTGDRATAPLRAYLRRGRIRRARLGPRDQLWPSGERPRPARRNRSGRCHGARSDGPCRLELGGVIVREVARELPDHVDGVVLFGSPIISGPDAHHRGSHVRPGRSGTRNGRTGGARRRAAGTGAAHQHLGVAVQPIGLPA